jgi:hypothetical protein
MATDPQYVEQVQSNIPAWMQPYAQQLLGSVFGGQDPETGQFIPGLVGQGYQPYMVPKRDAQGNILKDEAGKPIMQPGQRTAEFVPLQGQAFNRLAGMGVSSELGQAADIARRVGSAANYPAYTAATERQFYTDPTFERMGTTFERAQAAPSTAYQMQGPENVRAPQLERLQMAGPERVGIGALQQYQMGPYERVRADQFGLGAASQYMSPYMQEVVDRQKQAAVRDYARQLPSLKAAGVRAGASGGTREAILESEARRNLATQLGDIQAQGSQGAFQQAQAQYNADRARMLQAQQANQAAGLTTGQQNLAAQLGVQQLGTQAGLQAALANQQAGLTTGQQNLAALLQTQGLGAGQNLQAQLANQAAQQQTGQTNLQALINQQQFGAGQGLQAQQLNQAAQLQNQQQALAQLAQANQFNQQNAQQRAQYGLSGANLAEQSRQFGAGLGLQGLQQQLAAAGALGGLGMQGYQQGMGIAQAQLGAGGQQQALNQQMLNQQYQDFINQQQFPYKQAEFGMGILRGLPATGQTSTFYQQPGSLFGQIAGAGVGLGSLFGGLGQST